MNLDEFLSIWQQSEPTPQVILYRLYYNENGQPVEYSNDDKPGNYIDIDPETFRAQPWNIRVVNGQIVAHDNTKQTKKLVPNNTGTACDSRDICVIIQEDPCIKWSLKTYEPD